MSQEEVKKESNEFIRCKTVVIGAGFSGITASINLLQNGYEDFLVFEAHDRFGGRCYTIDRDKGFLEYGAEITQYQLAKQLIEMIKDNKSLKDIEKVLNEKPDSKESESNDEFIDFGGLDINITKSDTEDEEKCGEYFRAQNGEKIHLKLVCHIFQLINEAIQLAIDDKNSDNKTKEKYSISGNLYESFLSLVEKKFNVKMSGNENDFIVDLNEKVEKGYSMPFILFQKVVNGLYLWRWKWENIEEGCINLFDLKAKHFGSLAMKKIDFINKVQSKKQKSIKQQYSIKDIMETLIEKNKEKFLKRLYLNHSLKNIIICERMFSKVKDKPIKGCAHCQLTDEYEKVILIMHDNKTNEEVKVMCDNVICTMSLGFLKEKCNDLFLPKHLMNDEKLKSIARLGYGTSNKIFLTYEKPFWRKNFQSLYLVSFPFDKKEMLNKLSHLKQDDACEWYQYVTSFRLIPSHKNVLCASLGSNECYENIEETTIVKECTKLLKNYLKLDEIPVPKSAIMTKWHSDPFVRGSNTYLSIGSSTQDIRNVAEPIVINQVPYIMFAGEATDTENFSTILGAYLSGLRESNRILKITTKQKQTNIERPVQPIG